MIYEMTAGRPAFTGPTAAVVSATILHDAPAPLSRLRPDVPARLEDLVSKALEKDREIRCQSAAELRADLRRIRREIDAQASGVAPTGSSSTAPSAPPAARPRHRTAIAAGAGGLAFAAAIYFALIGRSGAPDRTDLLDHMQVTQLTTGGNANGPAISADGKYSVYVQPSGGEYSLWIRQVATASDVEIVRAEPNLVIAGATLTPDGTFVDFARGRISDGTFDVFRTPFLGGAARRLYERAKSPVGWSPDGTRLALIRQLDEGIERGPRRGLVVADRDGANERVLAERQLATQFIGFSNGSRPINRPAWSPDGRLIAVLGSELKSGLITSTPQVIVVDVASGAVRTITIPSSGRPLAWIDGSTFVLNLVERSSERAQLWRMSYPDGRLSRLTNDVK